MKGSPIKLGTIQGTAGHSSALKMKMEKDAAAKMKKEAAMKMKEEAAMKMKKESAMKMKKEDPMKMKKESPMDFNAKLKQASADGKLSGKFKEAVDASPAKLKNPRPRTKEDMFDKKDFEKKIKERAKKKKATKSPGKLKYSDMDYDQMTKDAARLRKAHNKLKRAQAGKSFDPKKKSPMKKDDVAYGGTVSWKEGMKKSGNRLNNLVEARKKYKKGTAEYNEIQNEINKSLGSKVRRTTKDESGKEVLPKNTKKTTIVDDKGTKDKSDDTTKTETKVKGLGRKKDKTLTFTEKEAEKAKLAKLKDEKKTSKTKLEKLEAKQKIANVKSGADDKYTGTRLSRYINKKKSEKLAKKIEKEKNKNKS